MTGGTRLVLRSYSISYLIFVRILQGSGGAPRGPRVGAGKTLRNLSFSPIPPADVNPGGILPKIRTAAILHAPGDNTAVCTSNHSPLFLQVVLPSASK